MLQALDVTCARGNRALLQGISLQLQPGEVLGVLGANGAGKSTLLATLAGERTPAAGCVQLDARPLSAWPTQALARRRAVLPQSPTLGFDLTVDQVVRMGAYPFAELAPRALRELAEQALALTNAQQLTGRRYLQLSGGEQQRVQFARVMVQLLARRDAQEYRALLLDEPTASLDPRHQMALLSAVRQLTRSGPLAALVVLHDVNLAAAWCDRILLLGAGRALALGAPRTVLTQAQLRAAYDLDALVIDHPEQPRRPWVLFRPPCESGTGGEPRSPRLADHTAGDRQGDLGRNRAERLHG